MQTFLWHDYETFGADPRRDRPAQFAAIRTDMALREMEPPMEIFCKPPADYLPAPEACLITGITPQQALHKGLIEAEFAQRVHAAFSQPGTIGVGYNTIRFDDEFTRSLFWRNLLDPYAREWRNGNARWDLLDVVRMVYALRPEEIEWPAGEDGKVSFKLENLSRANGLLHEAAHDAVSDVRATIALARLIQQKKPKLFEFALRLRDKRNVAAELGFPAERHQLKPFVHISGMLGVERGCMAVMWPLATHPVNRNEVLAWDLAQDPAILADLTPEQLRQNLFTRQADLPPGVQRLGLKGVHLNKSPMVVGNCNVLTATVKQRWGVDDALIQRHIAHARQLPDLSHLWSAVFGQKGEAMSRDEPGYDPEYDIYGGFVSDGDRQLLEELRQLAPEALAAQRPHFEDERLPELLWRYRARNFPQTLTPLEQARWERHRKRVLLKGDAGSRTASAYMEAIDALSEDATDAQQDILGELYDWADAIVPEA